VVAVGAAAAAVAGSNASAASEHAQARKATT
jgi:hypothetical protein